MHVIALKAKDKPFPTVKLFHISKLSVMWVRQSETTRVTRLEACIYGYTGVTLVKSRIEEALEHIRERIRYA